MPHSLRILVPAIALLTLITTAPAQAQGTGKKIGAKLDEVGRDLKGGLKSAGNEIKEQFSSVKTSVENMGVESRVYSRIHWDKALADATIELTASQDGVITLDGSVATSQAKSHAAKLAQETLGVTKVVDRLAVRPATTTTTSPARTSTTNP